MRTPMAKSTQRKINQIGWGLLLSGVLFSAPTLAANWWYVEAGASRARINAVNTDFNPVLPRLKLGFILTPQIMFEAQYAGQGDDTVANTKMEVDSISAFYLRLDSGFRSDMRMYVLLGGADTELTASTASGSNPVSDSYSDSSWGIGLESRVWTKRTLLTLEYTEYYNHGDITISATSLGFKFEF